MPTSFPASLDALQNPTQTDELDDTGVYHDEQHANVNDAIEALEAKVGVDNSAVTTSLDYLLKNGGLREGRPRITGSGAIQYGVPGSRITTVNANGIAANRLYYWPFWVQTNIVVDQLAGDITVAGAGGTTARFGIYRADTDLQPTSRIVDAGTVAVDSTGNKIVTLGSPVTLTPGRHLLAFHSDGAPTTRYWSMGSFVPSASFSSLVSALYVNTAYAALPDPGTAWTVVDTSTVPMQCRVILRVSTP